MTADHGYSFDVGVRSRRKVSETSIEEVAPVPFFIKAPGQTSGAVDRSLIRTIDILPTMADLLGVRMGWRAAGRPAARRGDAAAGPGLPQGARLQPHGLHRARGAGLRRRAERERRAALFLTGAESRRRFGDPWAAVHRVGTHPELLGRPLASLRLKPAGEAPAEVANLGLEQRVDPASELVPTRVTGTLPGGAPGELRDLAVAVNGRVRADGSQLPPALPAGRALLLRRAGGAR